MKTQQEIRDYIALHPNHTNKQIADNMHRHGVTKTQVQLARALAPSSATINAESQPTVCGHGVKPLAGLMDQFDDISKVQKAMRALPKAAYVDDDEMRRNLGISIQRWREVRSHPTLSGFIFKLPNNRFVWLHQEAQAKLTAAINLSQS